jgi:hypothetical protein
MKIYPLVGEFEINDLIIFPWGKCKIRIYELQTNTFEGRSDLLIKKKDSGELQYPSGKGRTMDEALYNTIENIIFFAKEYNNEIEPENIEYREYYEF